MKNILPSEGKYITDDIKWRMGKKKENGKKVEK
jgi:hypothetical protein